jgi:hypothetical protein
MNKIIKLIGLAVLVLAITFTFVSCGNGTTGGGGRGPVGPEVKSGTFVSWDGDTKYTLKITQGAGKALSFNPKAGDTYELTIERNGIVITRGNGTIEAYATNGTFTLRQEGNSGTFKIETSGETITAIPNPIDTNDGTEPPPANLAPEKDKPPIGTNLLFNKWGDEDSNAGERWQTTYNYANLTKLQLKAGDILKFTVSGKSNVPLDRMFVMLESHDLYWSEGTYIWHGWSDRQNLGTTFNATFIINIRNDQDLRYPTDVVFASDIWERQNGNETGTRTYEEKNKVMATIRNLKFELSVVGWLDPALEGFWVLNESISSWYYSWTFNDDFTYVYRVVSNDYPLWADTYGDYITEKGNITLIPGGIAYFGENFEDYEWIEKADFNGVVPNGFSKADFNFDTKTLKYSISGNTLTIDSKKFTRFEW